MRINLRWRIGFLFTVLALLASSAMVWGASGKDSGRGQRVVPPMLQVPVPQSRRPAGDTIATGAAAPPENSQPGTTAKPPAAPRLSAVSAVLVDDSCGAVLYSLRPHERRAPASLTKMVTAIIAAERGDMNSVVRVSANAAAKPPIRLGLRAGDRIRLSKLLEGTLMGSGNDAATAIAEHVAGSEAAFARLMNLAATKLGATESNFVNPHGLDASRHYSTAFDLAILARRFLQIPVLAELAVRDRSSLEWEGGRSDVVNINSFLWRYNGALGIKTGYTDTAKYSVAVAAENESRRLVAVLLGCPSSEARWNDAVQIMDYGFQNYQVLTQAAAARLERTYVVRRGDTLTGIARRLGTTVKALLEANPSLRSHPNRISVGQRLLLP